MVIIVDMDVIVIITIASFTSRPQYDSLAEVDECLSFWFRF